ncbi:LOW QUALITY PROTEIN: hypothetical protein AAY473_003017 [Plecturocebus cupreus]
MFLAGRQAEENKCCSQLELRENTSWNIVTLHCTDTAVAGQPPRFTEHPLLRMDAICETLKPVGLTISEAGSQDVGRSPGWGAPRALPSSWHSKCPGGCCFPLRLEASELGARGSPRAEDPSPFPCVGSRHLRRTMGQRARRGWVWIPTCPCHRVAQLESMLNNVWEL